MVRTQAESLSKRQPFSRVLWQTPSAALRDAFARRDAGGLVRGGVAYEYQAAVDLLDWYQVDVDQRCVRLPDESLPSYCLRIVSRPNVGGRTVYVVNPSVLAGGKITLRGKTISIVHHVDTELMSRSRIWRLFYMDLFHRLKHVDRVVVVSEYWRRYLAERGCDNLTIIYNSFSLDEFSFAPGEVESFRQEYGIPSTRPLVYIGNAGHRKGVVEVFRALQGRPYTLVVSGPKPSGLDVPVLHLDLARRDYLRLLSAADVVVAMSTMPEGWNRTAHEALLCKTPVIGSGSGGMGELLARGGQLLAEDVSSLPGLVDQAIAESSGLVSAGYAFASTLDSTYRRRAWRDLIQNLADG